MISHDLALSLALAPVGSVNVNHAGGLGVSPTYMVSFELPNHVLVAGIIASEFPAAPNSFGAIVGMDVICLGDFAITNVAGRACISFRMPSCDIVDFVVEANRALYAGTARNAPCPCGAGKKYKKCHGAIVAPLPP